ncbi:hypothetical protein HMPREF9374_0403 [Desmospora sp. 8437]|nr:hypothetical protein HMPREF9374_0403 [Desmospora sp. 8437]
MATILKCNFLYAQKENNVVIVGFADDEFNSKEYVLLQKSLVSEEQDRLDQVHITFNDPSRSAYGEIVKFVLKNDSVIIWIDSDTADMLETDEKIKIVFPVKKHDLGKVENYLRQIFSDQNETFVSEI